MVFLVFMWDCLNKINGCFCFFGVLKGEMVYGFGMLFIVIVIVIIRIFNGNNIYNKKNRLFFGVF